jgi:hypothetical protein
MVGLAAGQTWTLFWTLAVASVLVQTHISYAYILAVMWPAAAISFLLVRRKRPHLVWRQLWPEVLRSRQVLIGTIGLVLLWSQSLIEQFFGPGKGNLSRLASNAGGGSLQVGLRQAIGIVARVFALPPWWLRSGFSSSVPNTPLSGTPDDPRIVIADLPGLLLAAVSLCLLVGLLAFGFVRNRHVGRGLVARASVLALVGTVGSVLAVANLTVGPVGLSAHHVRLLWPLAVFVHTSALAVLVAEARRLAPAQVPRVVEWALPALAVAFGVLTIPYHAQPQGPVADYAAMSTMRRIMPHIAELAAVQPVLYDIGNLRAFEPYSSTMMMTMQEMDIEFRVDDEGMVRQLGESRRADGSERARVFQLQGPDALLYDGDACLVAIASQLSPADETLATSHAQHLVALLTAGSIDVAPSVLGDASPSQIDALDAALQGDAVAARLLVDTGTLSVWYHRGGLDAAEDLEAYFPLLDAYINTVYALYSEQSAPCPA